MRRGLVLTAILIGLAVACTAAELTEFGFQLNLSLQPFREEGNVRWWITVGAYGRITLDEEWRLRFVAGSGITAFAPFADVGLVRVYTPHLMVEGDLLLQSIPRRGLTATALVGGRYMSNSLAETRIELASFPLGWRLTSHGSELRGDFFLSGNLTVDFTIGSPDAGLIGQALALSVLRKPSGSEPPVIPLGGDWLLATQLITHIGVDL